MALDFMKERQRRKALATRLEALRSAAQAKPVVAAGPPIDEYKELPTARYSFDNRPSTFSR